MALATQRQILLSTALSVLVGVAQPSVAQEQPANELNFVLGNFEFVLLHELAHVIIGDKDIPILGPLESTADYAAIVMAIRGDGSEPTKIFLDRALADTATTFVTTWRLAEANGITIPYWDTHALSIQRYYATLCLFYGSDPDAHRALVAELPIGRAAGCAAEYQLADRGFQSLVDTFGRRPEQEDQVDISYSYGRVATANQRRALEEIRRLNLLESTVSAVDRLFAFEQPLRVVMITCGRPEAAWQPDQRELVICYELLDAFAQVHQFLNTPAVRPGD